MDSPRPLYAVSLWEPWATAILSFRKDIENRNWYTPHRGWILIHAAKTVHQPSVDHLRSCGYPLPKRFKTGGIIGMVRITDCVKDHPSPWRDTCKWGWVLKDPRPLPFFRVRGRQKLFRVDYPWDDAEAQPGILDAMGL